MISTRAQEPLRRLALALVVLMVVGLPGGRLETAVQPPTSAPSSAVAAATAPADAPHAAPSPVATTLELRLLGPGEVPLAHAHVRAWPELDPTAAPVEADGADDGRVSLALPSEGRWVIAATAPGFSEARAVRSLPLTETLDLHVVAAARVSGQVLGVDGAPAMADVLIVGSAIWPARSTRSDASGHFAFEDVPPGVYEVEARSALAAAEPRRGLVVEDGARLVLTLTLSPGRTLAGSVVDDTTGAPLAGAEIVVADSSLSSTPRVTRSVASGAFELTGLRDGADAVVTVRAEGHVPLVGIAWTGAALDLRLRRTGSVEGRVLDQDQRPVAGARIEVWGETADGQPIAVSEGLASGAAPLTTDPGRLEVTDDVPPIPLAALASSATLPEATPVVVQVASYRSASDGSFHIDGVAPGQVEVIARADGFATGESGRVHVTGGEVTGGVDVVLAPAGELTGVVVDERGDGVADVRIEARSERDPWPTLAFTDATGAFSIAATGDTVVRAVPLDRAPSEVRLAVPSGARRDTRITLDPAGLRLAGRVLDARGFPVESVQLRIESLRPGTPILRTAFSAPDGTFELASVPSPPLRVTVEHPSSAIGTSVDVTTLDELEIRLTPALYATGSVSDAWTAEPIPGARVILVSEALPPVMRETVVRDDGGFAVPRLRAGVYAMRVEAPGYVALEQTITARASRSGEVELDPIALDPGQRVEGDVVDRLGSVLEGAVVTVDGLAAVLTDAQGHFALVAVPEGDRTLHVAHEAAGTLDLVRHVTRGRDDVSVVVHLPGRADAAPHEVAPARTRGVAVVVDGAGGVTSVVHGSGAERAGIRAGDVVVSVDGRPGSAGLSGSGLALVELTRDGERFVVRAERELR